MAQTDAPDSGASNGLTRALTTPLRAVTRIFAAPAEGGAPSAPTKDGRSGIVRCGLYVNGAGQPGEWHYADALSAARKRDGSFVWLGLHDPGIDELNAVAEAFDLDRLAVEATVQGSQRPKVEQYGSMSFVVFRTARYMEHTELTEATEVVDTGSVVMFVGANYVVTVRRGDATQLGPVRAELEANPELLAQGPWAVVYAVCDRVVDAYLDVAAMVEADIDDVETSVFSRTGGGSIHRLYQLKRELVEFKRAAVPLSRPLAALADGRFPGVPEEVGRYFRDVNDHQLRVVEQIQSFDDLVNSILQARLAQLSVDQNHDMRKIAAWAAIAAVQTAIAGIYGMNFDVMPETKWTYGYPVALLVMLGAAYGLYRLFRRSGWL